MGWRAADTFGPTLTSIMFPPARSTLWRDKTGSQRAVSMRKSGDNYGSRSSVLLKFLVSMMTLRGVVGNDRNPELFTCLSDAVVQRD